MFQYSFFERDLAALKERYRKTADRVRVDQARILSDTAIAESATRDGLAHRMIRDHSDVAISQLRSMEDWISHATLVRPQPFDGVVRMGTVVKLKDSPNGKRSVWYCVASIWFPEEGEGTQKIPTNISYATPLARAIMGKRAGESVTFQAGGRTISCIIEDVQPGQYADPRPVPVLTQASAA